MPTQGDYARSRVEKEVALIDLCGYARKSEAADGADAEEKKGGQQQGRKGNPIRNETDRASDEEGDKNQLLRPWRASGFAMEGGEKKEGSRTKSRERFRDSAVVVCLFVLFAKWAEG